MNKLVGHLGGAVLVLVVLPAACQPRAPESSNDATSGSYYDRMRARLAGCADRALLDCVVSAPDFPEDKGVVCGGDRSRQALLRGLRGVPGVEVVPAGNIEVSFAQVGDRAGIEEHAKRVQELEAVKAALDGVSKAPASKAPTDVVELSKACFKEARDNVREALETTEAMLAREQAALTITRLGSSCEDVAALEAAATSSTAARPNSRAALMYAGRAPIADQYRSAAARRRSERVSRITSEIKRQMQTTRAMGDSAGKIPITKALVVELRCYDDGAATKVGAEVDAWAAALESTASDEESCRATPRCMGARLTVPLCEGITSRREALQSIAAERRNPAGVVDLNTLHDLGQQVQAADATIAELRTKYAAITRAQFNEASCRASECCVLLRELSIARDLKKQGDGLVSDAMRERYAKAATKCEAGAFVEMRSATTGLGMPNKCERL